MYSKMHRAPGEVGEVSIQSTGPLGPITDWNKAQFYSNRPTLLFYLLLGSPALPVNPHLRHAHLSLTLSWSCLSASAILLPEGSKTLLEVGGSGAEVPVTGSDGKRWSMSELGPL